MPLTVCKTRLLALLSYLALSSSMVYADEYSASDLRSDLRAFVEARDGWQQVTQKHANSRSSNDHGARLDLFGLFSKGALSLTAEYYLYKHHHELERFKISYQINAQNTLSLGRVHNNVGYWVTEFHHGAYIQDTINRPNVTAFEHGGIMPVHITGLGWQFQNENFLSELLVGYNPTLEHHGLEPVDLVDLSLSENEPVLSWRFTHTPNDNIDNINNKTGGFVSYGKVHSDIDELSSYKQTIVGGFNNWQRGSWRSISAVYYTHLDFSDYSSDSSGSYHGYTQLAYTYAEKITASVRFERATYSSRKLDALFPKLIDRKTVFALRWDFTGSQALKLELSDSHKPNQQTKAAIIQWSTVL